MRGHKNKKKRETDEGSTSPTEVEELIRRIEAGTISEGDRNLVVRLLRLMLVVQHSLKGKQATLLKLKQLIFGKGSDKQSNQSGNDDSTGDEKKAESESNKQGIKPKANKRSIDLVKMAHQGIQQRRQNRKKQKRQDTAGFPKAHIRARSLLSAGTKDCDQAPSVRTGDAGEGSTILTTRRYSSGWRAIR